MPSKRHSWTSLLRRPRKPERPADSQRLEDVKDLFERLGLDPEGYHAFSTHQHASQAAPENAPDSREAQFLAPTPRARLRGAPTAHPAEAEIPQTPENDDAEPARSDVATKDAERGYRMLQQLAPSGVRKPDRETALPPVVGLISYTGGVGKSTLTAALGAALAERGRRCVLVGQTPHSPLLYYFGGPETEEPHAREGIARYLRRVSGTGNPVELVIGEAPTESLLAQVHAGGTPPDIILLDMEASPQAAAALEFVDLAIVPLRPDVNALLTVDRMEQAWEMLEQHPRSGLRYVMNQFDAARNLHTQVRGGVRGRLNERLLPFALPLDNGVQEALACGEPPQIYDEHAPFALAVEQLATWIEAQLSIDADSGTFAA